MPEFDLDAFLSAPALFSNKCLDPECREVLVAGGWCNFSHPYEPLGVVWCHCTGEGYHHFRAYYRYVGASIDRAMVGRGEHRQNRCPACGGEGEPRGARDERGRSIQYRPIESRVFSHQQCRICNLPWSDVYEFDQIVEDTDV